MLQEPRSDIIKELTYSRQKTDNCSLINSAYGAQARLLSCTRVKHEEIPPINTGQLEFDDRVLPGYCYGKDLGALFDKPLTDNWFCCEAQVNNPATSSNPIYQ